MTATVATPPARRARGALAAAAALVCLLLAAGCGDPPAPRAFDAAHVPPRLAAATTELIGRAPDGDRALADAVRAARASVRDARRLSGPRYRARHGRPAHDQATLVGMWLAMYADYAKGSPPSPALVRAVGPDGSSPKDPPDAKDLVDGLSVALFARLPGDDADNPRLGGAGSLRSAWVFGMRMR